VRLATNSEVLLRRKQQVVQDAIWNAAIDLFGKKGFDETTVDDIAAAAGCIPTNLLSLFRIERAI
jgi:AcrR family transcriptional regulator